MTDGPYRDLGSGFVRLGGAEVPRRVLSPLKTAEDVLAALLDNSVRAGAKNIYVASSLRARRFRTLTVIDDGVGIPETHASVVFDPGVTGHSSGPAAGMSLHHIKSIALEAALVRNSDPTAFKVVLDTETVPEKAIQTKSPNSASNLLNTAQRAATRTLDVHYANPSSILAALQKNHIIQISERELSAVRLAEWGSGVGIEVSTKTAKRILSGDISPAEPLVRGSAVEKRDVRKRASGGRDRGFSLSLDERETRAIEDILRGAARRAYLSVGRVEVRSGEGYVSLKARLFEQEDEYG